MTALQVVRTLFLGPRPRLFNPPKLTPDINKTPKKPKTERPVVAVDSCCAILVTPHEFGATNREALLKNYKLTPHSSPPPRLVKKINIS